MTTKEEEKLFEILETIDFEKIEKAFKEDNTEDALPLDINEIIDEE